MLTQLMKEHLSADDNQPATSSQAVFFPGAPNPFSGSSNVSADTVERLEVRRSEVTQVIASFGAGTSALLVDRKRKE
jgi:uncharacterized membrane protein